MSESNRTSPALGGAALVATDAAWLDGFYRQNWSELCRYLNRTFGAGPPDPEDVAQAAFERLAGMDDEQTIENPRALLYKTARNLALHELRHISTARRLSGDVGAASSDGGIDAISLERVLESRRRYGVVAEAFSKLPEKQQIILTLKRQHGATFAEIASRTGWSVGDIHRQLAAAINTLRGALEMADRPRRKGRREDRRR